jgi:hypothetical protein
MNKIMIYRSGINGSDELSILSKSIANRTLNDLTLLFCLTGCVALLAHNEMATDLIHHY